MRIRSVPRPQLAALAAALALVANPVFAGDNSPFSRTVVFGDSLSDAGFFRPLLPATAQPVTGQFTTNPGLVWSQYLANYYGGNPRAAWLATGGKPTSGEGDNYAVGGARVAVDGNGALGYTPALASQVDAYLARNAGRADASALYTVWGGANDLFAITAGADAARTLGAAVTAQVGLVGKLRAAGAEYILVPSIPDLGVTPGFLAQGSAAAAQGTALAQAYNNALYQGLAGSGLRVIPLDTFHLLQEISASPAAYGISNVTGTACQPQISAQSLTCNPTSYVSADAPWTYAFADGVHPSSAAHAILADYAIATLEGPRQIALLPQAAAMSGRAQARMLGEAWRGRGNAEGGRVWGGLRHDGQRLKNAATDDGHAAHTLELLAGYDLALGNWVYGGYIGASRQKADYRRARGEFTRRETGLGGYLGWQGENLWLDGQLGWSRLGFDVRRDVPLGAGARRHEGSPDGSRSHVALGAGWQFGSESFRHGPVLRVLAQRVKVDGYVESQPTLATALAFPAQTLDTLQVSAGWQAQWQVSEAFQPYARVTLEREYGDEPAQALARMPSLAGSGEFAVPAMGFDRRYAELNAGVRSRFRGLDVEAGVGLVLGQENASQSGLHLAVGKAF